MELLKLQIYPSGAYIIRIIQIARNIATLSVKESAYIGTAYSGLVSRGQTLGSDRAREA